MTVTYHTHGNIAVVTINNPPVNAISLTVRQGLLGALASCEGDPYIKAVVLQCDGRSFVAGADIKEFGKPPVEPHLPDVLMAIEAATKPWVAAIHGTALGGGLELAMVCHARIATPDAKLGLPEVNLGLIPGAGGTVRLPRLVAPEFALTMIAGGKPVSATAAHQAGLIDAIADGDLAQAALEYAQSLAGSAAHTPTPTLHKAPIQPTDPAQYDAQKAKILAKARGQLSIAAAVAAVDRALGTDDPAVALGQEREAFVDLKASPQSQALRHIFFAERATLSDPRCKGDARPFAQVGVIGGGTMGAGIAAACLLAGLQVTMLEIKQDAADAGQKRVVDILDNAAKRGLISDAKRATCASNFAISTDYAALGQADLVIEAVFEDMAVKKAVFSELDRATQPQAILATNTSYLDINEIAGAVQDPSRVIGLHFFSPAHIMKLLEIVIPDQVSDDVVATAAALAKRLRKTAVLSGVCDGFIGNRIMSSYRREADYLLEDGATPQDVDAAMRDFGFPMGIFEMQDLAGLDIGWANRKRKAATRDPDERYVHIADRLCEAGRMGRKTGAGWYRYSDGSSKPVVDETVQDIIAQERAAKGIAPQSLTADDIMARILGTMQAEAQAVLADGIAQSGSDIDVVMTSGYSFPRWKGGPMFMLEQG